MTTLTFSTINMMFNDEWCFVCGTTDHIGHHCPDMQCCNCEEFGHFTQDCPDKSLHWEHLSTTTGWIPSHVTTITIGTDHSPLTTDTVTEDSSHGNDCTTNFTTTWALVSTEDMHPTPNPTTKAVHASFWLTDTLGHTDTGTHHTLVAVTHLDHATMPTRVTPMVIPQTEADLVWATLIILLKDHAQRKWQNCTQEQQPLINPTRRKSSFKIHNQTPSRIRHWL